MFEQVLSLSTSYSTKGYLLTIKLLGSIKNQHTKTRLTIIIYIEGYREITH